MPYCTILECKNNSHSQNLSKGGVTYHRFPKNPYIKEKWIEATGRQNWFPGKTCTVCSEHFEETDFLIKKSGKRFINDLATPSRNILHFKKESGNTPTTSSNTQYVLIHTTCDETLLKPKLEPVATTCDSALKQILQVEPYLDLQAPTHRKKNIDLALQSKEKMIISQNLKIKRLRAENWRLKKKIAKMEDILKTSEEKYSMKSKVLTTLKDTNVKL